jgi:hypothetical protein
MRTLVPAALTIISLPVLGHAQQPASSKESSPKIAEVRFGDGSVVRMTLLQQQLDVMTRYGKLSIPLADIRRIEFGLHIPDGRGAQISSAIKQLGSDVYRDREGATRDLLQAGHWACPALQRASKSTDPETAQRASQVLKQISDKTSPELLRLKEDDIIQTSEFTIVGRIVSPTLKAQSPHFGDVSLKLCDLRAMHIRQQCNTGELFVDAAKYGCEADQWLDTGVTLDPSMRLVVVANGHVDLWPQTPGQYVAGPKGYNAVGKGTQFMAGALVGRIGENGKPFLVGDRYDSSVGEEGKLYLHIVPSPWNAPSVGSFHVRIHTDPLALTAK